MCLKIMAYLCSTNIRINRIGMLGIKTRRTPVTGDIADNIRDAVARVATGQLNE